MSLMEEKLAQTAGKTRVQAADTVWGQNGLQMTENSPRAACLGRRVKSLDRIKAPRKCVSATNRHFPGRVSQEGPHALLAILATVTASGLSGKASDPRESVPKA